MLSVGCYFTLSLELVKISQLADELAQLKERVKKLELENARLSALKQDKKVSEIVTTSLPSPKSPATTFKSSNESSANQQPADSSVDIAEPESAVQKKRKYWREFE